MSDLLTSRTTAPSRAGRPDQLTVLGFATDAATETILRDGLSDLSQNGIANSCDIRRGTIKAASTAMMRMPAPQILVVDISGDDRPLQSLGELCDVIEPSISVLVLGDVDDVELYRAISRRIGAVDYIFKPITREMVARYFAALITNDAHIGDSTRGGRVIAVTGARGGVGASTIAGSLAWFLGVDSNRHTLLLDADLQIGVSLDQLGITPQRSLRDLLADPLDIGQQAMVEAATTVQNRLCVLASPPSPASGHNVSTGAVRRIIEAMRFRFNFIVVDLPFLAIQSQRELLELTQHRVIVTEPTVAGLRDTLRLLAIPNNPGQPQRPTVVLNREGRPGCLKRKHIEEALKRKVDLAIPDLPKQFAAIAADGTFAGKSPLARFIPDLSREVGFEAGRKTDRK